MSDVDDWGWCQFCAERADGPDEFCTPHREGVPPAITDRWLALQFMQGLRRKRRQEEARHAPRQ